VVVGELCHLEAVEDVEIFNITEVEGVEAQQKWKSFGKLYRNL
jgi:hypothetical protein